MEKVSLIGRESVATAGGDETGRMCGRGGCKMKLLPPIELGISSWLRDSLEGREKS